MLDFLRNLVDRILREPILLRNAGVAIVYLAALFGLNVNQGTVDNAIDAILTILALGASWLVSRRATTPVSSPSLPDGTVVRIQDTDRTTIVGG